MLPSARAVASQSDNTSTVSLGESVVPLNGPWRFQIGDSPIDPATGKRLWADPDFDDSKWEQYSLAPGIQNLTPEQAVQFDYLPGWQHYGHPRYAGYAWYRVRVNIRSDSPQLSLLMPAAVEDGYEIYFSGQLVGGLGKLDGIHLTYDWLPEPKMFSVPVAASNVGKPVTIAIRFWSMPWEALPGRRNLYGGLHGVPLFGSSALVQVFLRSLPEQVSHREVINLVLYGGVGLISIFLFWFSRGQREYLWAGIALVCRALLLAASISPISYQLGNIIVDALVAIGLFSMPMAGMYLLGVPRRKWIRANYFVFLLGLTWAVESNAVFFGVLPPHPIISSIDIALWWVPVVAAVILILLIAIDGIRTIGRRAWFPMVPGIFFGGSEILTNFEMFSPLLLTNLRIVEASVIVRHILQTSVPISVLFIFLIRFTKQQRENVRLLEDMRQAREVQQVILPEALENIPGFRIESIYEPARDVGGDFFQVLPIPDGGLFLVIGDVAGKGLPAAMLVSLLIGTIRTAADETYEPDKVLSKMNERLVGRTRGGFSTALVALITADGSVSIANAGHLPPYLDGNEVELPGALPLGITSNTSYEVKEVRLEPTSRLTFYSDGVVEAQNKSGELLGFDHARELSTRPAATIVEAAKAFGQQDDITVITVERVAVEETFQVVQRTPVSAPA